MTQRRDPLGLLDIFWRDMERIFGTRRGTEDGNSGSAAAGAISSAGPFPGLALQHREVYELLRVW